MAGDMRRYRVNWTGVTGLPGISTFYQDFGGTPGIFASSVRTFFDTIKAVFPPVLSFDFNAYYEEMDSTTGHVQSVIGITKPTTVVGTGISGPFSSCTGFIVDWLTNTWISGRRVIGKTYMVPCNGEQFTSTGVFSAASGTLVANAASTYLATSGLTAVVWHRPKPRGAANGSKIAIASARVPSKPVILTSRRD